MNLRNRVPRRSPSPKKRRLTAVPLIRTTLFILLMVTLYLNVGITFDKQYYSGLVALCFGSLLFLTQIVTDRRSRAPVAWLVALTSLWGLTIIASPSPIGFFSQHMLSLTNLMGSVLIAYASYREIRRTQKNTIRIISLGIVITLLTLAFLEVFTSFREVVTSFRSWAFGPAFLYSNDARDLLYAGRIRPTGFTQEPSHLAKGLAIALAVWILASSSRMRYWIGGGLWLVSMYLVGSPTLMLAPGIVAVVYVFQISGRGYWGGFVRFATVAIPVICFTFLSEIAALLPFARAQAIALGTDNSAITRTIGPVLVAWHTLLAHPIAGAAIGGRELVTDIVVEVYRQFPGYYIRRLTASAGYTGWGNAFFEIPVYSGLIFGLVIWPALYRSLRLFGGNGLLSFGLFFIIFNLDSGFVSLRPWFYFAIAIAVAVMVSEGQSTIVRGSQPRRKQANGKSK